MTSLLNVEAVAADNLYQLPDGRHKDYLLYLHTPFCESLCPYCSFHRCEYQATLVETYFRALKEEISIYRQNGFRFRSAYIGGGTPTIRMDLLVDLIESIQNEQALEELSIETNPNHLAVEQLQLLKAVGVNRLSVGVQSFDDQVLHHIGRLEKYGSSQTIIRALSQAQGIIDTLNVDLIFNIPIQTDQSLRHDLDVIHSLKPDQVTFYPLMAAPSVERTLNQMLGPLDFFQEQRQYQTILAKMSADYIASTAWCFSRSRTAVDEYLVEHDEYVGLGSGSFGFFNGRLFINTFSIGEYNRKLLRGEWPLHKLKTFAPRELRYYLLLRRLFSLQVKAPSLEAELRSLGASNPKWLLNGLRLLGLFDREADTIKMTEKGMYFLIMAMREFFIAVDTIRDQYRCH